MSLMISISSNVDNGEDFKVQGNVKPTSILMNGGQYVAMKIHDRKYMYENAISKFTRDILYIFHDTDMDLTEFDNLVDKDDPTDAELVMIPVVYMSEALDKIIDILDRDVWNNGMNVNEDDYNYIDPKLVLCGELKFNLAARSYIKKRFATRRIKWVPFSIYDNYTNTKNISDIGEIFKRLFRKDFFYDSEPAFVAHAICLLLDNQ